MIKKKKLSIKSKLPKAGNGLNTPIKGTKEQYQAYQDSLDLYNSYKNLKNKLATESYVNLGSPSSFSALSESDITNYVDKGISSGFLNKVKKVKPGRVRNSIYSTLDFYPNSINENLGQQLFSTTIKPKSKEEYREHNYWGDSRLVYNYDNVKPVQPIIYQPDQGLNLLTHSGTSGFNLPTQNQLNNTPTTNPNSPWAKLEEEPPTKINIQSAKPDLLQGNNQQLEFSPIGFQKGSYFTRDAQNQEVGGKEYFDKKTGKKLGNGGYTEWKSKLPKNLQYEGDYDLRGLYNSNTNVKPSANMHFPDTYKLPNHPTFSNESKYFNFVQPQIVNQAGHWDETDSSYNYIPYNTQYKDTIIEPKEFGGRLKKYPTGGFTDPRQDSYYTPSSSDKNIQQNLIKQQEINKIKNQVDFPLYKSNENTKELKTQIGDQSEILKNSVFKDQLPEYVKYIKNHPEEEKFWKKETLEKAKNYGNDTSKYLAAFQLLKENGNPYITQNPYFEDKYRKNINAATSNFRPSKNLMYLEPNDREGFIGELSHAQQLKDNFLEDKNVIQKLDSIYKKEKQTNPNLDYHKVYDKYYYDMPNSIEHDAHTLREPKLQQRYDFLTDSFRNELPFMSFTPQYKVDEKIKLDNAGKDYYKGNIGDFRRTINKGIDNIFGTDVYKAFGNDPKKQKFGGNVNTDWEIVQDDNEWELV